MAFADDVELHDARSKDDQRYVRLEHGDRCFNAAVPKAKDIIAIEV
jgi:hypothetical protein